MLILEIFSRLLTFYDFIDEETGMEGRGGARGSRIVVWCHLDVY